jgi:hypothetical protein
VKSPRNLPPSSLLTTQWLTLPWTRGTRYIGLSSTSIAPRSASLVSHASPTQQLKLPTSIDVS